VNRSGSKTARAKARKTAAAVAGRYSAAVATALPEMGRCAINVRTARTPRESRLVNVELSTLRIPNVQWTSRA